MKRLSIILAALAASALSGCAAAPPKVLVLNQFNGIEKTSKILIQDSGQIDPSTKKRLYQVYVRVCDIAPNNAESACKDTKVIDNVVPGSVY